MRKAYGSVYVGDIFDAEIEGDSFERVICVSQNYTSHTTDYLPLEDSDDCEYESFEEAVDCVLRAFESEDDTLLHCNMGASRSVCVAAAAISRNEGWPIDKAIAKVQCGSIYPHPKLKEHAREYARR